MPHNFIFIDNIPPPQHLCPFAKLWQSIPQKPFDVLTTTLIKNLPSLMVVSYLSICFSYESLDKRTKKQPDASSPTGGNTYPIPLKLQGNDSTIMIWKHQIQCLYKDTSIVSKSGIFPSCPPWKVVFESPTGILTSLNVKDRSNNKLCGNHAKVTSNPTSNKIRQVHGHIIHWLGKYDF